MKGLTHFISGVAAATCFPQAMQISQLENSYIIVLGGIFGILPDTIDFKFCQFFEKYDYIVDPDPRNPDPQMIADTIAQALNDAHDSQQPKSIIMHTIKKGSDTWRQYRIFFDIDNKKVRVTMGNLVNFSKVPYPNTELSGKTVAEADIHCQISKQVYDKETFVDIMTGPSFMFIPQKDGTIKLDFLSWHRRWSHSLTLGVYLGLIGWFLLGFWLGWSKAVIYGLVITSGVWVHVLQDQLGYMGSNLFWPFTKNKTIGTKTMHSGDAWPNFSTVWLAVTIILFNMDANNAVRMINMPFWQYFIFIYLGPLALIYLGDKLISLWEKYDAKKNPIPDFTPTGIKKDILHQTEVLKEVEDSFA